MHKAATAVLVSYVLLFNTGVYAQNADQDVFTFLAKDVAFSNKDIAAVKKGDIVTRLIDVPTAREIAIFSAMRLNMSANQYLARLRSDSLLVDMATSQTPAIFKIPPGVDDLRALKLDPDDLKAIRTCRIGDCKIKLSADMIKRLKAEVDWKSSAYPGQALRLYRQMMVDYVHAYLIGGNAAMAVYHDKQYPLRLVGEFHDMLQQSSRLYTYHPDFYEYLAAYPTVRLDGVEDFIYWAKEDVGARHKIITLNHVNIFKPEKVAGRAANAVIATKQLYASHYSEASLSLTSLAADPDNNPDIFYLLFYYRTRIDVLRESLSELVKRPIRNGIKEWVHRKMERVKSRTDDLSQ